MMTGTQVDGVSETASYRRYVLCILAAVTVLNYFDRSILFVVLDPLKQAWDLSDGQAGILSGVAFALVYSLFAVPVARLADRRGRVRVLAVSLAAWSGMTAMCGLATSFAGMFVARMGVGLTEAGGFPLTQALVAEYFPANRRGAALSIIGVAATAGTSLGLLVGGFVAEHLGWRAAFWIAAAPGLLLAVAVWATIREPGRSLPQDAVRSEPAAEIGLLLVLRTLWGRRSFVWITLGSTICMVGSWAHGSWMPTVLVRTFGLSLSESGGLYSLLTGPASVLGMIAGGIAVDRWIRRDQCAAIWIMALNALVMIPLHLAIYLAPQFSFAAPAIALSSLFSSVYVGANYSAVLGLAGPAMRATAAAVFAAIVTLVSMSVGPAAAGILSDMLQPVAGADSLRYALSLTAVTYLASALCFLAAARSFRADLAQASPGEFPLQAN